MSDFKQTQPKDVAPQNLNFADLVHEHDTFTDTDGTEYEFIDKMDFGAVELAKAERWQKLLPTLSGRLRKNTDDEAAAAKMEDLSKKMVGLILPGVPEERIETWTLRQRVAILEFWSKRQADKLGEEAQGEAGAGQAESS
jgi:hypothetical protein